MELVVWVYLEYEIRNGRDGLSGLDVLMYGNSKEKDLIMNFFKE
jgi:hypothetical protein